MKPNDLTGRRFDRLTALYPLEERRDNCVVWMCRCDCGAMKPIPSTDLTRRRVKSCGCLKHRFKDITGERRGHLTALRCTGQRDERGRALYEWRCDCGNVFVRPASGTARDSAVLCDACRRAMKASHINAVRENREVDDATGLTRRYLQNLVRGVLTGRNTSGVRGVYWHAGHKRWVVTGRRDGRLVTLGEFEELRDARELRERYVLDRYGLAAMKLGVEDT